MNTLGKRILYLRKKYNLTQKQLADATGLQRGNLSHYEKDKIKPSAEAIIALAGFLKVSTDWLLIGTERSKDDSLFIDLNEKEILEVELYIEFMLWKKGKAKQSSLYIAEELQTFEQEE